MRKSRVRVFIGALVMLVARSAAAAGGFTVDQVLADLNLPADAAARIRRGEMVHSDPKESSDREMAVGLTFLVQQRVPRGIAEAWIVVAGSLLGDGEEGRASPGPSHGASGSIHHSRHG